MFVYSFLFIETKKKIAQINNVEIYVGPLHVLTMNF